MSRPWILEIVCCCWLASSTAVGWGQEYLDLPEEEPRSQSFSLTDKLLSLKDKFRRDRAPANQSAANGERATGTRSASQPSLSSNPRTPRYRSAGRSAPPSRRYQLNDATQNNASQNSTSPAARRSVNASLEKRQPATTGTRNNPVVTRPGSSKSSAENNDVSRSDSPLQSAVQLPTQRLTRAANQPRAGSAGSQPRPHRVARKSPATSRANELDAALADLLKPQSPTPSRRQAVKSAKPVAKQSVQLSAPITSPSFDLRKALLDDPSDEIAAEVARAVDGAAVEERPAPVDPAGVAKAVESQFVAALVKQQPVVESPAVVSAAVAEKKPLQVANASSQPESTPSVANKSVATKKAVMPPVIAQPVIAQPVAAAQPVVAPSIVIEPIVVKAPAQPSITIAESRPSPTTTTRADNGRVDLKPFGSTQDAAKQVFSTGQPVTNPMRSFQPNAELEPIVPTIARPERGVLQTTQQPVIVSHVEGPKSILVGREATYQVTLENTSNAQASDLLAEIRVPEWAELVDVMSTSGVVERQEQGADAGMLEWKLSKLAPRTSQALRLRLIPRSGRPLQLGVRWSQAPAESQAIVEVQEPKLELAISGPQEVRYGKPQRYRLTLRNPGSGLTEQVSLRLVPPGGDAQSATTQKVGDLKPGEVRDIELELTAREAGALLIQADASAQGGLKAAATKKVLCRKPELSVDWRGPDKKYAGTVAAYYFRIRNPGTAATAPVDMSVKLPVGAEFVSASDGYSINRKTGVVSWRLAGIDVQEEQFTQMRCKIDRPGKNDFQVRAKTGDGELNDSKDFHTEVVALADLKLEVSDPQGPLPLGESVVYEIRVRNRGTTDAENINVVGLFSEGIDPTTVEGAQFTLRDGRVGFHPIKSLPAGREILLRIHAKANQVGTHTFRTEVVCPKLDIKLAAEETTRFFEDEHRWENGQTPYTAEREATLNR